MNLNTSFWRMVTTALAVLIPYVGEAQVDNRVRYVSARRSGQVVYLREKPKKYVYHIESGTVTRGTPGKLLPSQIAVNMRSPQKVDRNGLDVKLKTSAVAMDPQVDPRRLKAQPFVPANKPLANLSVKVGRQPASPLLPQPRSISKSPFTPGNPQAIAVIPPAQPTRVVVPARAGAAPTSPVSPTQTRAPGKDLASLKAVAGSSVRPPRTKQRMIASEPLEVLPVPDLVATLPARKKLPTGPR